jgi:surface carbohydrate biosynthesis protein
MKKIKLLSPNKIDKIEALFFLENFYLNKGFTKIKNEFYHEKLINFLKKYIIFIKKIKLVFSAPQKKEIIIYDTSNTELLKEILPEEKMFMLAVRKEDIKEIYFSAGLFFFLLKNFFKNTIKQNYLIYLIKLISPKAVITAVENSIDFYFSSKAFEKSDIKFAAVQHSCLRGTDYVKKNEVISNSVFIPKFFCFSDFEKKLFENTYAKINKFIPVGSLKAAIFLKQIKERKTNLDQSRFDICLIGEPAARTINDLRDLKNYYQIPGQIAEFVLRLCKKNNLKLIFSGKNLEHDSSHLEEKLYYKHFLKDYNFEIYPRKDSYTTFENAYQSKLIIGHCSTFLREILALKKKVLTLNLSGHHDVKGPFSGIGYLEKFNYDIFEERVMNLISMKYEDYQKKTPLGLNHVVAQSNETISKILKEVI